MIKAIKKALRWLKRRKAARAKAQRMIELLILNGHLRCPRK